MPPVAPTPGPLANTHPDAFRFGRNWQRYVVEHLTAERKQIARDSLVDLLDTSLSGKRFLDLGAGSGLFSLCAFEAGAREVVSVDVDLDAVASCEEFRRSVGRPHAWRVVHGSVLDHDLIASLGPAEVVYSWGALHHTGSLYDALRNASQLVAPGGILAIAIYNRATGRFLDSERWVAIKRRYNRSSRLIRAAMELAYMTYWAVSEITGHKNPVRAARHYKQARGMALRTDVVDWLGGYPYEYATVDEIVTFCEHECSLKVRKIRAVPAAQTGNNEFVFERFSDASISNHSQETRAQ